MPLLLTPHGWPLTPSIPTCPHGCRILGHSLGYLQTRVLIPALPLLGGVTQGKSLGLSEPQYLKLKKTHFTESSGLSDKLYEATSMEWVFSSLKCHTTLALCPGVRAASPASWTPGTPGLQSSELQAQKGKLPSESLGGGSGAPPPPRSWICGDKAPLNGH